MYHRNEKFYHGLAKSVIFALGAVFLSFSVHAGVDDVLESIEKIEKEEIQVAESSSEKVEISKEVSKVEQPSIPVKKEKKKKSLFGISLMGGTSEFASQTTYIESQFSGGIALDLHLTDKLSLESSFMYAQFDLPKGRYGHLVNRDPYWTTVRPAAFNLSTQYRGGAGIKYRLWDKSFITPVVGAGLSLMKNNSILTNNQVFGTGAMSSGLEPQMAANIMGGLELNLGGMRIGGMVKAYSTLSDVTQQSRVYNPYNNIYNNRNYADPADLKNNGEFVEFLGVVSFDL